MLNVQFIVSITQYITLRRWQSTIESLSVEQVTGPHHARCSSGQIIVCNDKVDGAAGEVRDRCARGFKAIRAVAPAADFTGEVVRDNLVNCGAKADLSDIIPRFVRIRDRTRARAVCTDVASEIASSADVIISDFALVALVPPHGQISTAGSGRSMRAFAGCDVRGAIERIGESRVDVLRVALRRGAHSVHVSKGNNVRIACARAASSGSLGAHRGSVSVKLAIATLLNARIETSLTAHLVAKRAQHVVETGLGFRVVANTRAASTLLTHLEGERAAPKRSVTIRDERYVGSVNASGRSKVHCIQLVVAACIRAGIVTCSLACLHRDAARSVATEKFAGFANEQGGVVAHRTARCESLAAEDSLADVIHNAVVKRRIIATIP